MSHFNAISHRYTQLNCVFTLRRPTHSELSEIMSHVYLFSHVGLYVFLYLLNYITSLYWKLSENYKHGCRNDQPICKNKGRNESKELSSNNLRFFQNNLGLVYYTTYSCIFHSCYLLLHFPLLHFPPVRSTPAISTPAFSVAPMADYIAPQLRIKFAFPISGPAPLIYALFQKNQFKTCVLKLAFNIQ